VRQFIVRYNCGSVPLSEEQKKRILRQPIFRKLRHGHALLIDVLPEGITAKLVSSKEV
jgi:hypothetical protein